MYKTKMTFEVEVSTFLGPESAVNIIRNSLECPAVESLVIIKLDTDYKAATKQDLNLETINSVPCKLI